MRFKSSKTGKALAVTVKDVKRVNGELISGNKVTLVNAPMRVARLVSQASFSRDAIERAARHAIRDAIEA